MPAYISIADNDDAGEWASVLPFCLNIKISDYAGGNRPEAFASPRTDIDPFAVRSCPGPDALLRRAGVTVETMADAGTGEISISHDASISRGGQHDHVRR